MKRKRLPPDKRLDWRDPNMPVHRGYIFSGGKVMEYVTPEYETAYRAYFLDRTPAPPWRNDPTYNMRRK